MSPQSISVLQQLGDSLHEYSPEALHEHSHAPIMVGPGFDGHSKHTTPSQLPTHSRLGSHAQPFGHVSHASGRPKQLPGGQSSTKTSPGGHFQTPALHVAGLKASPPHPGAQRGVGPSQTPPLLDDPEELEAAAPVGSSTEVGQAARERGKSTNAKKG